jgi:hypothetical protein
MYFDRANNSWIAPSPPRYNQRLVVPARQRVVTRLCLPLDTGSGTLLRRYGSVPGCINAAKIPIDFVKHQIKARITVSFPVSYIYVQLSRSEASAPY